MAETIFREYRTSDVPAIISLWGRIFGDSYRTVSGFFSILPGIGSCFVAEQGGRICGMASVLTDLVLRCGDTSMKCAYIYAVATDDDFRDQGIGGTLSRMAAEFGKDNGAKIISTLPANEGLYAMYEKTIGLDKTLRRRKASAVSGHFDASASPMTCVSPEEYNRKREALLSNTAHISVSDKSIEFLRILCSDNGGDIYAGKNFCAAMYSADDEVFFTELICPESERTSILSLGAAMKNRAGAFCYVPSDEGEKYISYSGDPVYHNPIWNITFE